MKLYHQIKSYTKMIKTYHISTYAASASFFFITSFLPFLMLILSALQWAGLDLETEVLNKFPFLLPDAVQGILSFIIQNLRAVGIAELSISVIALLWSASRSMIGFIDGLNNIAGIDDHRNFLFKRLICLFYMIVFMAGLLLTLGLRVFGHTILTFLEKYLPHVGTLFSHIMEFRGFTLYLIITVMIALVFSFFPNRRMPFVKQLPGAAITSAAWLLFSAGYSLYIKYVSGSSALYGSLGTLILAMFWVYFCIYIIFIGAVINHTFPNITTQLLTRIKKLKKAKKKEAG